MQPGDRKPELMQTLQQLRWRALGIGSGASFAWGLVAAMLCLIVSTWVDVVFDLSPQLRIALLSASAGAGGLILLVLLAAALRSLGVDSLTRRLDAAAQTGGQIRVAADLLRDRSSRSPLAHGLARMAIERAATLAGQIPAPRAVPVRPLTAAAASVVTVSAIIVAAAVLARPMTSTEYARFMDPYGDHPPYSRILFAVKPGNGKVVYGASQEIAVATSGPPLERLELVLLADNGQTGDVYAPSQHEEVLPMFGEPGGRWRATVANLTSPTTYYVRGEGCRSHRYQLSLITLPHIEAVRCRVTPPAYTNRGPYEGPVPPDGIAGLPGTLVQLWVTSNRPLAGGQIKLSLPQTQPVSAGNGDLAMLHDMHPASQPADSPNTLSRQVTGTFQLRSAGRLEIRVRDVEGQPSQETFAASLALRVDERPYVRLLDPPEITLATPNVELPVALAAEDDYGISRLELYRSLNDSRATPVGLPLPAPPPPRQNQGINMPVPTYGLHPGDEIKLFARVEDNDPAAAKGAESPLSVVRIISQEDYERLVLTRQGLEVLQAKYEQARERMEEIARRVEVLQKELATMPADSPLADEMRKKIADLADHMKQQADEMAKSAETKLPFDIDEKMSERLKELADKLGEASKEVQEFATSQPAPEVSEAKEGLEAIAKFLKGGEEQYEEQTTEPLQFLASVYRLMEDQQRFVMLYQRQKELADRAESLRDKDSPDDALLRARMRDLESEQYKIREDLKQLLQDIADHVAALPEDESSLDDLRESATAFVNGVRDSGAEDTMADAETALAAFAGTRAADSTRKTEEILKEFLAKSQQTGEQGRSCLKFQPGLGNDLGNTLDQLLDGTGLSHGKSGTGGGSGYSAQSSTLDNVGLYGRLPALGGRIGGEGHDSRAALGRNSGAREGNFESGDPGRVDPLDALRAAGAGQNTVPPQYRDRVGAYFERITDETAEKRGAKQK